ncbi:AI-2E family transporter [Paracoccus sp. PAR01]|uniref:AI-2E family transporter n=1 Tax=Paracoccus sp. PAR01 TaxID=2769282 RepID=UPI0017846EC5|nr:AI-2E family transporter [Paracoccus sp. PAR01]MBD9527786.1 AI-2E family transporter [Paracoccus sp. PAR01]
MDNPKDRPEQFDARVTDLVIRLVLLGFFTILALAMLRPFLPIIIWAIVLAVALAPLHVWLARLLGGRRKLAAILLTLAALAMVLGPVAALMGSLFETVHKLVEGFRTGSLHLPKPPQRLLDLPLIGAQIREFWGHASTGLETFLVRYREFIAPFGARAIGRVSELSFDLIKFIISIVMAGLLLVPGPELAIWGRRVARRLVAPRGDKFVDLATVTVRNVSRGVVGVAMVQASLIGLVLQLAGLPSAGLLALVILILCILQLGPALVVLPLLIWAWFSFTTGHALLLTVILLPLTFLDNVLKPMLMGRGLSTPTFVIFLGLVGGTLSFGLTGLFLGPVVLAVFHDLLMTWLQYEPEDGTTTH